MYVLVDAHFTLCTCFHQYTPHVFIQFFFVNSFMFQHYHLGFVFTIYPKMIKDSGGGGGNKTLFHVNGAVFFY
jgi:hypothetical protein